MRKGGGFRVGVGITVVGGVGAGQYGVLTDLLRKGTGEMVSKMDREVSIWGGGGHQINSGRTRNTTHPPSHCDLDTWLYS